MALLLCDLTTEVSNRGSCDPKYMFSGGVDRLLRHWKLKFVFPFLCTLVDSFTVLHFQQILYLHKVKVLCSDGRQLSSYGVPVYFPSLEIQKEILLYWNNIFKMISPLHCLAESLPLYHDWLRSLNYEKG